MLIPPQPRFRFYNGLRNYRLALQDLVSSRIFEGSAVEEAERLAANWLDVAEVILTPQGRYGIYLGLLQTIRPGQDVIMSPYTLYDVVNMVVAAGGVPKFADIDEETCNISPDEVEKLIGPRTGAVLVTHMHGLAAPLDKLCAVCDSHRVPLLEDACQAFGAQFGGRKVGTIGSMGFFSCGRAKNINAFLGGMIATNDRAKAAGIRKKISTLPYEHYSRLATRIAHCAVGQALTSPVAFSAFTYWIVRHGILNGNGAVTRQLNTEFNPVLRRNIPEFYERQITQMQARLILDQIDRVDSLARKRINLANIYSQGLRDVPGIELPPQHADFSHIYLGFPIQVEERDELQRYMVKYGRDVAIQHIGNTADYPCFDEYRRDCPHARRVAARVLLLPSYPSYRSSEARKNVDVIRNFFARSAPLRQTSDLQEGSVV